jgi:uncharacterized protein
MKGTNKPWVKRTWNWLQIIFVIYVVIGVLFYFFQDKLIFNAVSIKSDKAFEIRQPFKEIDIPITQTDTISIVDFTVADSIKKGIVLFFHGNMKNINHYIKYAPLFTGKGYEVLMMDYPGYGKSRGTLTEQKLYDWSLLVYKLALSRIAADSIIIYGKSIGTGIAAQLASVRDCKRLILETPYYDLPAVVKHYMPVYPIDWMMKYQVPTWRYIQNVSSPISIFHGTKDRVVPYRNSLRLKYYFKKQDELITIKGGSHNRLFDNTMAKQILDSLLDLQ